MKARGRRGLIVDEHVVLPKGTRAVVIEPAVDDDGHEHRSGAHVIIGDVTTDGYRVRTPRGAIMTVRRAAVAPEQEDALAVLSGRKADFDRLRHEVVLATVVGSRAWGLADDASDTDVRGCFVLPFVDHASLYDTPHEIHDGEEAFWEIETLVRQALRADPNTLETLWSPLVRECTGIGARLVRERQIFSSRRVVQSFGRYAASQLKKLEAAAARRERLIALIAEVRAGRVVDEASAIAHVLSHGGGAASGAAPSARAAKEELTALARSVFDRGLLAGGGVLDLVRAAGDDGVGDAFVPAEVRPKNAYNLVRLLMSCEHWLAHGAPLIEVTGAARDVLLGIKRSVTSLDRTLALANDLAQSLFAEEGRARAARSPLPPEPDVDAADALVKDARRAAARVTVAVPSATNSDEPLAITAPLPSDVDVPALQRFLVAQRPTIPGRLIWLALTGAHAYGFPSPDSDLDLKGIHASSWTSLVTTQAPAGPREVIVDDWEGRELDLSSHELGLCAELLLKGNGNMLERLLGPWPIVQTPFGAALAAWAQHNLTSRSVHHYKGFLGAMLREHAIDVRDRGGPRAKRLLYMYRTGLTGVHLLRAGALVTDVRDLAPLYGYGDVVKALIARKTAAEGAVLDDADGQALVARAIETDALALFALLEDALLRTSLPAEAPDVRGLDALLVEGRRA